MGSARRNKNKNRGGSLLFCLSSTHSTEKPKPKPTQLFCSCAFLFAPKKISLRLFYNLNHNFFVTRISSIDRFTHRNRRDIARQILPQQVAIHINPNFLSFFFFWCLFFSSLLFAKKEMMNDYSGSSFDFFSPKILCQILQFERFRSNLNS